jgi:hypothetical protein
MNNLLPFQSSNHRSIPTLAGLMVILGASPLAAADTTAGKLKSSQVVETFRRMNRDASTATNALEQTLQLLDKGSLTDSPALQEIVRGASSRFFPAALGQLKGKLESEAEEVSTAAQVADIAEGQEAVALIGSDPYPRNFFHIGLTAISPYKVGDNNVLARNGNDTRGFVEYVFGDYWAFTASDAVAERDPQVIRLYGAPNPPAAPDGNWPKVRGAFLNRFDSEFRAGFTLGGNSEKSASTITGSGDFNLGAAFGYQLFKMWSPDWRMSVGPVVAGGLTTDLSNLEVHPNALVGVGWNVGLKPFLPEVANRRIGLTFRAGYAWTDVPRLGLNESGQTVVLRTGDRVDFDSMRGGFGVGAHVFYPVTRSSFLTFGGRIQTTSEADQWTFYVGYVQSIGSLWRGFFGDGTQPAAGAPGQGNGKTN